MHNRALEVQEKLAQLHLTALMQDNGVGRTVSLMAVIMDMVAQKAMDAKRDKALVERYLAVADQLNACAVAIEELVPSPR